MLGIAGALIVVIAVAACDGWFNPEWFPSYEETYEALQGFHTAEAFLASEEAARISVDRAYCDSYSKGYTYHPFHAMSMISGGAVPLKWCSQVYLVGAAQPTITGWPIWLRACHH